MKPHERVFVALDTSEAEQARRLARTLAGHAGGLKIGLELFCSCGPELVREMRDWGTSVFVDLKLHDIPTTVAGAAAALGRLGASFFTLHGLGGTEMIRRGVEAAAESAAASGLPAPTALVVTLLTSHGDSCLERIGLAGPYRDAVLRLTELAREAGAGGVVCSASEVAAVRRSFPRGTLVVPGIRPPGASRDDQARTATPAEALARGADRLVIGRPITRAANPLAALERIVSEIER